jgi:hypothetical protein
MCTLLALATLAGCQRAEKTPVHETFTLVSAQASANIAAITYGTTTAPIRTPGDYAWLRFCGHAGDSIDLWVRGKGDAIAFLLDANDDVLAANDDADATTTDAHLAVPLSRDGTYYIAFRERSYVSASFVVTLAGRGVPVAQPSRTLVCAHASNSCTTPHRSSSPKPAAMARPSTSRIAASVGIS